MHYYRVNEEKVAWRIVDDGAVMVHAETSAYYSLNETGTSIWVALCDEGVTAEHLAESMRERYALEAGKLTLEIESFLQALLEEDLVECTAQLRSVRPEGKVILGANKSDYEPPALEHFGELEKLILSGE
jgi:hypothetical protein